MRPSIALGAVMIAACHPAGRSVPEPARCEPRVPATAEHPINLPATALAGDYQLIQVRSQPVAGVVSIGRLHLAPLDSVARAGAVGGAVRDLEGRLDPAPDDSTWRGHPEAALSGQHLRLGSGGDLDGYREYLTITAVTPDGFWGWWKADHGLGVRTEPGKRRILPDPAGYFCALRVPP